MFKEKFKYFKRRNPEPDFTSVIDVSKWNNNDKCDEFDLLGKQFYCNDIAEKLGLKSLDQWQIVQFRKYPGLIYLVNPFTGSGQRYWISRAVRDYSRKPSVTNLDSQIDMQKILCNESWWEVVQKNQYPQKKINEKLRWATFGYHHNWDTKIYSNSSYCSFPTDLVEMTKFMSKVILNVDFNPEACIVNYYLMDSFLSGHVDHSEPNITAPLLSYSFGQAALFLIGGHTLEEDPEAILLRSGDLVIMTGDSRLRYHAIPRIIKDNNDSWNVTDNCSINSKPCNTIIDDYYKKTYDLVQDEVKWDCFKNYISSARININIRQVH